MNQKLDSASTFLTRCMLALFLLVMALALFQGFFPAGLGTKLLSAVFLLLILLLLPRLAGLLARLGPVKAAVLLAALCLVVKGLWVAFIHPLPYADFEIYYAAAVDLSQGSVLPYGRYVALFPHVFGYSAFLGLVLRLFGVSLMVPLWTNVVLSVVAGLLLFGLARCWLGLKAGVSAFLLWIFCPSQTFYNSVVLADLYYTTLLLAFLLLAAKLCRFAAPRDGAPPRYRALLCLALTAIPGGLFLRLVNTARPIAAVPIIALLLWLLLLRGREIANRRGWALWLPFLVLLLAVYAVTGPLWNARVAHGVGEEPPSLPGYNLYVGFNQEYSGQWNQEDSDLLFYYSNTPGATASWAQEQMLAEAKARITSGEINFPKLMYSKLGIFLGDDSISARYCSTILPSTAPFEALSNGFYYVALLLALAGGVRLWLRRERSASLLLPLLVLGLVMAQLLVEVASRYHYSLVPIFLLIGQFALYGGSPRTVPAQAPNSAGQTLPAAKPPQGGHPMSNTLYIVVPCYNEEEVLPETSRRLGDKLNALISAGKISPRSRVLFVNDGSKDRTWDIIARLHQENPLFCGVDLSRNRGHQNALLAGLMTAREKADMVISMDADLQDDVDAVDAMVDKYLEGVDIVYGVRSSRKKDSFFKRTTAEGFYRVMNAMGAETVFNHADYRLMSRRALDGLAQFKEVNLFLRGVVPMIGYRTDVVEYERGERFAGESKYPLKKMLAFALEGITSLSVRPLRMITGLGFLVSLVSLVMIIYNVIRWAVGKTVAGWASIACSVWLIGGLILLSLGVIGEYIGKLYMESKERPRFLIREVLDDEEQD